MKKKKMEAAEESNGQRARQVSSTWASPETLQTGARRSKLDVQRERRSEAQLTG